MDRCGAEIMMRKDQKIAFNDNLQSLKLACQRRRMELEMLELKEAGLSELH